MTKLSELKVHLLPFSELSTVSNDKMVMMNDPGSLKKMNKWTFKYRLFCVCFCFCVWLTASSFLHFLYMFKLLCVLLLFSAGNISWSLLDDLKHRLLKHTQTFSGAEFDSCCIDFLSRP